jgi:hypothetical protein
LRQRRALTFLDWMPSRVGKDRTRPRGHGSGRTSWMRASSSAQASRAASLPALSRNWRRLSDMHCALRANTPARGSRAPADCPCPHVQVRPCTLGASAAAPRPPRFISPARCRRPCTGRRSCRRRTAHGPPP